MNIIFLLCRSKYRKENLNNFSSVKKIGKYKLIILYSFFSYLVIFIKKFFNVKIISIDSFIEISKNQGFHFWMTGTIHKIPKIKKKVNDYVNMKNVFHKKDKIFQLYPLNISKGFLKKREKKIIYASTFEIRANNLSKNIWKKKKNFLLNKFDNLDKQIFWKNSLTKKLNDEKKFLVYRDLKSLQRSKIIENIYKNNSHNISLFGQNWSRIINKKFDNINHNELKKLYKDNICLDLGSKCGSLTLYPRSIQIIENGGLLLQLKQSDSQIIFGKYEKLFTFTSFKDLNLKLKRLLNDTNYYYRLVNKQFHIFKNSYKKIEKQLDEIF